MIITLGESKVLVFSKFIHIFLRVGGEGILETEILLGGCSFTFITTGQDGPEGGRTGLIT